MLSTVLILLSLQSTFAFVLRQHSHGGLSVLWASNLPSIDELKSKPFIDQVGLAAGIVPLLETKEQSVDDELLTEAIAAQLSHSDGIRGFFVSYLTGGDSDIDEKTVPKPLLNAMKQVENQKDLTSLACMNVIMPTAMVTMHTDEELSKSSAMTAARGKIVAGALMNSDEMRRQAMAIVGAASGNVDGCEKDDIKYWKDFFQKWGYGEEQLADITSAFLSFNSM